MAWSIGINNHSALCHNSTRNSSGDNFTSKFTKVGDVAMKHIAGDLNFFIFQTTTGVFYCGVHPGVGSTVNDQTASVSTLTPLSVPSGKISAINS